MPRSFDGGGAEGALTQECSARRAKPYGVHFPLFDHVEARSNEVRQTQEGLVAHPRVDLVDDPEAADYLILCQNHLVEHCPFHTQFRPIKDRYKHKTIMLDYHDDPTTTQQYRVNYDKAREKWKPTASKILLNCFTSIKITELSGFPTNFLFFCYAPCRWRKSLG